MARVILDGNLVDQSAVVDAALADQAKMWLANIYMIGESYDPRVLMLTDWESPLWYKPLGVFQQGVTQRDKLSFKIGLAVSTFGFTYSPSNRTFTNSVATTSELQLAHEGYYDLKPFRMWRVWMPTPGDPNTWGVTPAFGGWIKKVTVKRESIEFSANCFLDVLNQQVPSNTIDNTSSIASYAAAFPPAGFSHIPRFQVVSPSDERVIRLACTTDPSHAFTKDVFRQGYLAFDKGTNETLGGFFSIIGGNVNVVVAGVNYTDVTVIAPFPWPPTPLDDTCFVSAPWPVDGAEGTIGVDNWIFPYVPSPESAG